jgi:predicted phage terminase large subunit-like protein
MMNDIEDPTKSFNPGLTQQNVERIRQDKLKRVNSPRWGAILLCNYISKQSIVHELLTGEYTSHFNKQIVRALVPNGEATAEDRKIARAAREGKHFDKLKSAWEFRHPTVKLLEERSKDPETFDPEMMMHPRDRKNQKFRDVDFKFYAPSQIQGVEMVYYTFVDPSAKEANDYKAHVTIGIPVTGDELKMYLVNAWIRQDSVDAMLEESFRDFELYGVKIIGVEMIGFAVLLAREYGRLMKQKGKPLPIHQVESVKNKDAKIEGLVPIVRSGTLLFDPTQGDQALLIRQFKGFPDKTPVSRGGIGDDGPDAIAECIKLIQDFPLGANVSYKTVQKRLATFKVGAY